MKRLLLSLIAPFAFITPILAGLGEAESLKVLEFDAWCEKKGNDCKVVFTSDFMSVNGVDGIKNSQMHSFSYVTDLGFLRGMQQFVVTFKEQGSLRNGTFIFRDINRSEQFKKALISFCPSKNCQTSYLAND